MERAREQFGTRHGTSSWHEKKSHGTSKARYSVHEKGKIFSARIRQKDHGTGTNHGTERNFKKPSGNMMRLYVTITTDFNCESLGGFWWQQLHEHEHEATSDSHKRA